MHGPAVVDLRRVSKRYEGHAIPVRALDDVSVSVARGERVVVTGASGSGKSTLLHIAGLVDRPSSGEVRFLGRDAAVLGSNERAALRLRSVGLVFQHFYLHPTLNALDNVALPAMEAGAEAREARDRAAGLLGAVALEERLDHAPAQLSGGEQQRVAIARALVNSPALLLADEPTGELDSASAHGVMDLLDRLWNEHGFALVLATHDPALASRGERLLRLSDGRLS